LRYLVTGGAGFIGSNIANFLSSQGHEVLVLDDLFLGSEDNLDSKVSFIRGSVLDERLLHKICKDVDGIFHEAALSSAPMFLKEPLRAVNVDLMGFLKVLEVAREYDIPVVYASTSSLYNGLEPPHREDMEIKPKTFYEYTFLAREKYARLYFEYFGVRSIALRYFSVYGPNEMHKGRYANLVSQFIWAMLKGRRPVIYGDGSQTRDFIYVDDVVRANLLAMKLVERKEVCEVVNVGTGKETSLRELIDMISEVTGSKLEPLYTWRYPKGYVYRTKADTSKARGLLGFEAKVDLREGIGMMVNYYKYKLR